MLCCFFPVRPVPEVNPRMCDEQLCTQDQSDSSKNNEDVSSVVQVQTSHSSAKSKNAGNPVRDIEEVDMLQDDEKRKQEIQKALNSIDQKVSSIVNDSNQGPQPEPVDKNEPENSEDDGKPEEQEGALIVSILYLLSFLIFITVAEPNEEDEDEQEEQEGALILSILYPLF
jgi:hypothetical protein